MKVSLIAAMARDRVIGRNNRLPWKLPADLKRFKQLTMGHPIIMGRKTYESLGKPLPGRTNIVVTRQPDFRPKGCLVAHSLQKALTLAQGADEAFVIGGAQLFEQALGIAARIYLTDIHEAFPGDVHFPPLDPSRWREMSREEIPAGADQPFAYSFVTFDRINELPK